MNKFDAKYFSIKKIITEEVYDDSKKCYIDISMKILNDKLCDGGISFEELEKRSKLYEVLVKDISRSSEEQSIRITAKNKQELLEFLGTFINSKMIDYVASFILKSGQTHLDNYIENQNLV